MGNGAVRGREGDHTALALPNPTPTCGRAGRVHGACGLWSVAGWMGLSAGSLIGTLLGGWLVDDTLWPGLPVRTMRATGCRTAAELPATPEPSG